MRAKLEVATSTCARECSECKERRQSVVSNSRVFTAGPAITRQVRGRHIHLRACLLAECARGRGKEARGA